MPKLDARETAALLTEMARRTELAGGNPYRARAYARAADSLLALTAPLDAVIAGGRLLEIPGVGETIADVITGLQANGTHPILEKMRDEVPAGVLEMLAIPGLRADKVKRLHGELGIGSVAELEDAARNDRLSRVKGIGAALQKKILDGIAIKRTAGDARHIHRATELLAAAVADLGGQGVEPGSITVAGDVRRASEVAADLALVVVVPSLSGSPQAIQTGDIAITATDARRFGISLLLATGSAAHLDGLRARAAEKGMALTPDGLSHGGKIVAAKTEASIYKAVGLQFIPPELREGADEIARAAEGRLPMLVEAGDIRGILHAHTVASDGANTLREMADATRQRGYEYFGVADHSQTASYAGGLTVDAVERQQAEIRRLNASAGAGFRIFKGIESDILPDGSLDYPDEVLATFDFVVASIHGQFRKDREAQTERILRAVANPFTTILGHPTGRQLLRRPGYEIDIPRVLAACAEHGVAVEINANPWRLDLDWRWHALGLELGCMFSINPDAHSTAEIDLVQWGVGIARKGGIPKERVLNCLDAKAMGKFLAARRGK